MRVVRTMTVHRLLMAMAVVLLLLAPESSAVEPESVFEKVRLQRAGGARESPVGRVMEEARGAAAVTAFGQLVSLVDLEGIPTVPQGLAAEELAAFLAAHAPAVSPPAGFPASFPEEMDTEMEGMVRDMEEALDRERRSVEKRGLYQGINLQFYEVSTLFFLSCFLFLSF